MSVDMPTGKCSICGTPDGGWMCGYCEKAYKRGREDAANEILKLHGINDVNCYEDYQCYAYQQAEKAARGGEQE